MSARLDRKQIAVVKGLRRRAGLSGLPVGAGRASRAALTALWRRGLIDVWYRQAPETSLQGPYYALTLAGLHLALAIESGGRHGLARTPQ